MNLIHLELQADRIVPDWEGMMDRLAPPPGEPDRINEILVEIPGGEIYTRARIGTMIRYLEDAWNDEIEDGYRKVVAGAECLLIPDYTDEESGKSKGTRLNDTVRWLLEDMPWVLESGGFATT